MAAEDGNQGEQPDANRLIEEIAEASDSLRAQVREVVVGQEKVVEEVCIALFCSGHGLLVGVPGLAKTLLVSTIAEALDLEFRRIQFTPDLMPGDITGTEVLDESPSGEGRRLRFVKGPLFANAILADEVNRTPPKTQSALLEGMEEQHVTAGGQHHPLPPPFFVLATQNPIEQEGTYPLPEAQLDRFMLQIQVSYPDEEEELEIVRRTTSSERHRVEPVLDAGRVLEVQGMVRQVPVPEHVARYALSLVRATRPPESGKADPRPGGVGPYLAWGAGPRASQYLVLGAKGRAVLQGRAHPTLEDVRALAHPVLRHRLIPNFGAEAEGVSTDDLINRLLEAVPEAGAPGTAERMDTVYQG
jgi:MoxR-like ATPase